MKQLAIPVLGSVLLASACDFEEPWFYSSSDFSDHVLSLGVDVEYEHSDRTLEVDVDVYANSRTVDLSGSDRVRVGLYNLSDVELVSEVYSSSHFTWRLSDAAVYEGYKVKVSLERGLRELDGTEVQIPTWVSHFTDFAEGSTLSDADTLNLGLAYEFLMFDNLNQHFEVSCGSEEAQMQGVNGFSVSTSTLDLAISKALTAISSEDVPNYSGQCELTTIVTSTKQGRADNGLDRNTSIMATTVSSYTRPFTVRSPVALATDIGLIGQWSACDDGTTLREINIWDDEGELAVEFSKSITELDGCLGTTLQDISANMNGRARLGLSGSANQYLLDITVDTTGAARPEYNGAKLKYSFALLSSNALYLPERYWDVSSWANGSRLSSVDYSLEFK